MQKAAGSTGLSNLFFISHTSKPVKALFFCTAKVLFSTSNSFLITSTRKIKEFALLGQADKLLSGQLLTKMSKI